MATDRFTKENALHELYNYVHEYSNAVSFENTINTFILRIFFLSHYCMTNYFMPPD